MKTEYSQECVPLDAAVVEALMLHQTRCVSTPGGWLFANPATGRPFHQEEIQKNHLRKAGVEAEIDGDIGWHTFRHSYRSWLDDTGAPLTVQKELMRHSSIQTTMNVYGKAMTDSKRQAHSKAPVCCCSGPSLQLCCEPDAYCPSWPSRKCSSWSGCWHDASTPVGR